MMKSALVIIDIQRWFFRTPERLAGLPRLVEKTNELASAFHARRLPIVRIITVHKADRSTWSQIMKRDDMSVMVEGTPDVEELPELHVRENDIVVAKTRHSAFIRTELERLLRSHGIDTLVLTGAFVDGCVGLTAIDAYERDFRVTLAKEATVSVDKDRGDAMLSFLGHEFEIAQLDNRDIFELIVNGTA